MYNEETYPKPIFKGHLYAVLRTDITLSENSRKQGFTGVVALDENSRPATYVTQEQAEREMVRFKEREPERTFGIDKVHTVGCNAITKLKRLDEIEKRWKELQAAVQK